MYTHLLFYVAYHSNLIKKTHTEMQELLKNTKIAGTTSQPCIRSYDVVTTGKFITISTKFSSTFFFKKYLSPLVHCVLQTEGVCLFTGTSIKLLAYSSELRVLDREEISTSKDSVPHMDRTRDIKRPAKHDRFRVLLYLSDSVGREVLANRKAS